MEIPNIDVAVAVVPAPEAPIEGQAKLVLLRGSLKLTQLVHVAAVHPTDDLTFRHKNTSFIFEKIRSEFNDLL